MFFLLRVAFWLGIVLLLLPIGAARHDASTPDVGPAAAISAASATVKDLRGFCSRQPDACTVGSQVAVAIGYRAQAGAKMLYDFLTEAMAPHTTGSSAHDDDARTVAAKSAPASENTLTPADLAPAWHGPRTSKPAKHSA